MAAAEEGKLEATEIASLYAQHGEALKRFLVGLLRDPQLANDVLQATFAKLLEQGHETRKESRRAWLYRVAYHAAMHERLGDTIGEGVETLLRVSMSLDVPAVYRSRRERRRRTRLVAVAVVVVLVIALAMAALSVLLGPGMQ